MRVTEIPVERPRVYHRCEAKVGDATANWREFAARGYRQTGELETMPDYQCEKDARYEIDGVKFCRLHAGHFLLDKALKEGEGR